MIGDVTLGCAMNGSLLGSLRSRRSTLRSSQTGGSLLSGRRGCCVTDVTKLRPIAPRFSSCYRKIYLWDLWLELDSDFLAVGSSRTTN